MKRIFQESHEKLQAQHCIAFSSCSSQPTKGHVQPWNLIRTNQPSEDVGIATCDLVDADSIPARVYSLSPALGSLSVPGTRSMDVGVSSEASVTSRTNLSHAKEASCTTEESPVDKRNFPSQRKSHSSSGGQETAQTDTTTSRNAWLLKIDAWLDTVAKEVIQGECKDVAAGPDQTQTLSDLDVFLGRFEDRLSNSSGAASDDSKKENISPDSGSLKELLLRDPRECISFSRSDSLTSSACETTDTFYNAYPRVPQPSPTTPVLACEKRPWRSVAGSAGQQSVPSPRQSQLRSSPGRAEVESLGCASSCDILSAAQHVNMGDYDNNHSQSPADNCPDSMDNEVAALSPHVTPYRKGKAPKRPRRPSYYDPDILFRKGSQQEDVSA
ncbi:hypothetical protein VTN77DRAFT_7828 [Rasamsonia byssochlamydoides]|uniref:uncharacterized protein n=1 Tax=Rasamsonia byssochlamydoides TaxID=89139 RepID=UPI00374445E5